MSMTIRGLPGITVPFRLSLAIERWYGATDGDPDEVIDIDVWVDTDGSQIDDPSRIAELEARV